MREIKEGSFEFRRRKTKLGFLWEKARRRWITFFYGLFSTFQLIFSKNNNDGSGFGGRDDE